MGEPGRPAHTEADYQKFLDDMAPFLRLGHTLYGAICDASLVQQKDSIYIKYKLKDWFSEKIDAYQATPGILANDILTKVLMDVNDKLKQGRPVSEDEMKNVRFMAEKHRTAQPFFVTRTETAPADETKVGKTLDTMEQEYDNVGREAKKQMVAVEPPVQDKGQAGTTGNVPA